ncbi:MAG: hypothetical protein ABSD92_04390 [Candidatus Bathyarchaeia archaeon]|jgi:hypothetical protein
MSSTTKAKINLKEGTIELEGSEDFVIKQLESFQKQMQEVKISKPQEDLKQENSNTKTVTPLPKKKTVKVFPQMVAPIPLDLKAKDGKPSLREFFDEKKPKTQQEEITVFAYYLKHHLNINDMQTGHVISCCTEVKCRKPVNMLSSFKNIQHYKGWVDVGAGGESASITTSGENLVECDLPRKEDAATDKTTT